MVEENGVATESRTSRKRGKSADGPSLPTRIAEFFRETVSELRRVVWPTRKQVMTYTVVVVVFVAVLAVVVNVIDLGVGQVVLRIFGN